jgi:hypothetical protein
LSGTTGAEIPIDRLCDGLGPPDLGERPAGRILVLIDLRQDFAPGNCRWALVRNRPFRSPF